MRGSPFRPRFAREFARQSTTTVSTSTIISGSSERHHAECGRRRLVACEELAAIRAEAMPVRTLDA
jgi:hypothetical protein